MSETESMELKTRIQRDERALSEAFQLLRCAVVAKLDPLERVRLDPLEGVRTRPLTWFAGALLLGCFLGIRR